MTPTKDKQNDEPLNILYEDNHLLGVYKPAGVLMQGDRTGDVTLLELAKAYLKKKYQKPGKVFLGLVQRIDRPVSGVAVFARTSKAASRLTNEFRLRQAKKTYVAIVLGSVREDRGQITSYIERAHLRSRIAAGPSEKAREASLQYEVLERSSGCSLVEITPHTGRHHQIRVQMSHIGHPVVGDLKYGAREPLQDRNIALHAASLVVKHPTQDEDVTLAAAPPATEPWRRFATTIANRFG